MANASGHESVLLEEAVDAVFTQADGVYVDATFGRGGHTKRLLDRLSESGRVIAFDRDADAIAYGEAHFAADIASGRLQLIHQNFQSLQETVRELRLSTVDGILYDLGVSSPQFDDASRGFTYRVDAPLDMRMDQRQDLTAETIVNEWPYQELVRIFRRYGEEPFAKPIARAIERQRAKERITSTGTLVELIKAGIPAAKRRHGGHPAKRVFQAIRIAVNDELGALETSLEQALSLLSVGGRIAVISFQSLEDRLVKTMFREASSAPDVPKNVPLLPEQLPSAPFTLITKKPIVPSPEEIERNPRAHSAKLRVITRVSQ